MADNTAENDASDSDSDDLGAFAALDGLGGCEGIGAAESETDEDEDDEYEKVSGNDGAVARAPFIDPMIVEIPSLGDPTASPGARLRAIADG